LIGKTYGKRFEIQDKLLHEIAPVAVQEIGACSACCVIEPSYYAWQRRPTQQTSSSSTTAWFNRSLRKRLKLSSRPAFTSPCVPSLTTLASLSLTGAPQEIIKKQTEQHAAFKLKNEYSKEKYKKRKEAK
jgi:hypothetical protein